MLVSVNLFAVDWNTARLVEQAVIRDEGRLTSSGALVVNTGQYTGRSPDDKFIVEELTFADRIAWGGANRPLSPASFERLYAKMTAYLQNRNVFVFNGYAGAHPNYRLPIRVVTELAWHNLFARNLFIRPSPEALQHHVPEFTVFAAPGLKADPDTDGTRSEAFVVIHFGRKIVLIGGTAYAGEIKKAIFTVLNGLAPQRGIMPMHCAANTDSDAGTALFFGLSGTGKTTLSADPERSLIGDDEHGWSDEGIFNFEGGCYAKCIGLNEANEPQIWRAIRFGAVLENVVVDEIHRKPDFYDASLTENTRAAYPLEHIENAVIPGIGGHPRTICFLTADAFGVLPPIARLDTDQALYYFLSGYTSKLAGTERGVNEPVATFSSCFGEPFLPLPPLRYAEMLRERILKHQTDVYMINTGWTGGPYGVGQRIPLPLTRAMVRAALRGELAQVEYRIDPIFQLRVPLHCSGVPSDVLDPRSTWQDPEAYEHQARELAGRFRQNFRRFGTAGEELAKAGPVT